jgi:hypothetical protein
VVNDTMKLPLASYYPGTPILPIIVGILIGFLAGCNLGGHQRDTRSIKFDCVTCGGVGEANCPECGGSGNARR